LYPTRKKGEDILMTDNGIFPQEIRQLNGCSISLTIIFLQMGYFPWELLATDLSE
jgi:hypothetical protein